MLSPHVYGPDVEITKGGMYLLRTVEDGESASESVFMQA